LLPYFRRLGEDIPAFDFSLPGVTSISMDLHKYGYTPKNASIVLYRNKDLRRHQIYACSNWTGYTIVNNTIQSSKTGGPLAAAWAVVNFLGDDGYLELARRNLAATKKVIAGIKAITDLKLLGEPQMCLISFTSETVNVFHVIDEMKIRGWYIQPQLGYDCSPENIHLSINASSMEMVDGMLADLRECVEIAKTMPASDLAAQIKQVFGAVDPASFDQAAFESMLTMAGMNGVALPERMAEINEVLNALPAGLREKLMVEFLNQLFVQPKA
jgi:glutamate/tyrosine decarboxylase-like PLP-dependent enzyme